MTQYPGFFNDGSTAAPRLSVYLNLGTLTSLPDDSIWSDTVGAARNERLLSDGFEGVQIASDADYRVESSLPFCGQDRINTPAEADPIVAKYATRADSCITLHVGWGLEDDDEVFRLVHATLNASERYKLPIFIETHRATITQDLWRTVQLTKRFPEIRFNGDFSHYYCGQELVYGDWQSKLDFMQPIFERIGFLHGRIASPGCMQVPIDANLSVRPRQAHGVVNYLEHFKEMWIQAMLGFLHAAQPGDVLIFAPELLASTHYYARMFVNPSDGLSEECDRYSQALLYKDLAHACFEEAKSLHHAMLKRND